MEFSRLRISATTYEWNRYIIQVEFRVYNCVAGGVQDEHYALPTCGHCNHIRNYMYFNINLKHSLNYFIILVFLNTSRID